MQKIVHILNENLVKYYTKVNTDNIEMMLMKIGLIFYPRCCSTTSWSHDVLCSCSNVGNYGSLYAIFCCLGWGSQMDRNSTRCHSIGYQCFSGSSIWLQSQFMKIAESLQYTLFEKLTVTISRSANWNRKQWLPMLFVWNVCTRWCFIVWFNSLSNEFICNKLNFSFMFGTVDTLRSHYALNKCYIKIACTISTIFCLITIYETMH